MLLTTPALHTHTLTPYNKSLFQPSLKLHLYSIIFPFCEEFWFCLRNVYKSFTMPYFHRSYGLLTRAFMCGIGCAHREYSDV